MSLSSKLMASMLAIPNEVTLTAANFNFDFSLMKVDAPKEFHGVRDALSHHRRSEAEEGQPHVMARKLGALFESLAPPSPHLLAAYGERVSEISSRVTVQSCHDRQAGIFAAQAGPDATNIWAAATSGRGALAMHLLACLLSRIWKSHEAISIWVELVERRKQEIAADFSDNSTSALAAAMASKQMFDREHLAAWDSSARSWLQTADATKRHQHTQLMLIINNIGLPVNPCADIYESVIKAWTSALCAMERLVQGIPQQVQDGSVLLGISAWHLYPDMEVLTEQITTVVQNDKLMEHALLTIPSFQDTTGRQGVFWSLPLSRMRYYSPPVLAERHLASDTSRITMEDLHIIVLGTIISQWGGACPSKEKGCEFIVNLASLVTAKPAWLELLADAARKVLTSRGPESRYVLKLFRMGARRYQSYLCDAETHIPPPPFFGLSRFSNLLLIVDEVESTISFFREIAGTLEGSQYSLIIRYREKPEAPFEYASALPQLRKSRKRTHDHTEVEINGHTRLIPLRSDFLHQPHTNTCVVHRSVDAMQVVSHANRVSATPLCPCVESSEIECPCASDGFHCSLYCHPLDTKCSNQAPNASMECVRGCPGSGDCVNCFQRLTLSRIGQLAEECTFIQPDDSEWVDHWHFRLKKPDLEEPQLYDFLLGDGDQAAIFVHVGFHNPRFTASESEFLATINEVERVISSSKTNPLRLSAFLKDWWSKLPQPACGQLDRSFRALVFANSIYKHMMGATIDIEAVELPLYKALWSAESATVAKSFACIAMFESGEFDLDPSSIEGVLALATGDSIYVVSTLLADPADDTSSKPIQRVFGNLGRPEMVLLIAPAQPRLVKFDPHSWRMVNHDPFDGTLQDSYTATSLHLSFTDFELAIDIGQRGLRDNRVILKESLISVNDYGKHIGDLDILAARTSPNLLSTSRVCEHNSEQRAAAKSTSQSTRLVLLDN